MYVVPHILCVVRLLDSQNNEYGVVNEITSYISKLYKSLKFSYIFMITNN